MKKISILSLHLGFGGIEKSIVSLANFLSNKYEVEIACTYKLYDEPAFKINPNVKIKYLTENIKPNRDEIRTSLKNKNLIKLIKEVKKASYILRLRKKTMINYIKNCDSDVVISTRDIFNFWLSLYGKDNVMKIGWEHNHYHGNMKYAQSIVTSSKNLDYLVLVSNSLKEFYDNEMKNFNCKCVFIPNVIEYMPTEQAELSSKKIISVGRLSPEKGYMDLLILFKKIHSLYPEWGLDIVGDGIEKNNLQQYIDNNNLSDCVILHGFRDKEYIDDLLNKSSIYLMTSYTESFGIVLLEAMSHGLPCIAFNSAEGANELIKSGYNGYLIKNRNFDAFIKKTCDLINNKNERKRIGNYGIEFSKKYTIDVVGEQWIDLIEKR